MQIQRVAITDLEIWPVRQPSNGQAYVLVQIATDAAVSGWGEVAVRADPGAVVRQLEACRRDLVGQDPTRIEHLRQVLQAKTESANRDGGDVLAGFNMAQLDLLGKLSRAPVFQVLGGPTRSKVRALAPLAGGDEAALLASLAEARQAGYRAVRVPLLLPAGPTRARRFYERTRQLLDRMRSTSGGDVDFVLDCGGRTTEAEAVALADSFEGFHLLWLDEPAGQIQQQALSGLGGESATPIGWGRNATSNAEFQDLLRQDAVDVLRPDVSRLGITAIRKAAAIAETYYVAVAPFNSGGPIATAAALQIAASIPNFFIQDVPFPASGEDRQMRRELAGGLESPQDGFLSLPSEPGLGISIAENSLRKYRIDT